MTGTRLHYIYDPLCGWCYAVAPLVKAAREVASIELHGGGMMTGARRQQITPAWREYVAPHDRQITQATGQQFGQAYLNGLLTDHTAWLDSESAHRSCSGGGAGPRSWPGYARTLV